NKAIADQLYFMWKILREKHKNELRSSKTALTVERMLGSPSFNLSAPGILNSPQYKVNYSK
ncbi:unnamed protein product, partial [Bubo scandiacus]